MRKKIGKRSNHEFHIKHIKCNYLILFYYIVLFFINHIIKKSNTLKYIDKKIVLFKIKICLFISDFISARYIFTIILFIYLYTNLIDGCEIS